MKFVHYLLPVLLIGNTVYPMQPTSPVGEYKSDQIKPYLEQLKNALLENRTPEDVQKIIETIQAIRREFAKYPLERKRASNLIAREKAFLVGQAKSAAQILDTQVKQLTSQNKPIFDGLKKKHANAYINIELINEFLATLE